jgi:hypothetical protein
MVGNIIGIALGIGAILLGAKGFTPEGLPFTSNKRITGTSAQIIGVICILVGLVFVAGSIYPFVLGR